MIFGGRVLHRHLSSNYDLELEQTVSVVTTFDSNKFTKNFTDDSDFELHLSVLPARDGIVNAPVLRHSIRLSNFLILSSHLLSDLLPKYFTIKIVDAFLVFQLQHVIFPAHRCTDERPCC